MINDEHAEDPAASERVAIVGAGPAGLTAADQLAKALGLQSGCQTPLMASVTKLVIAGLGLLVMAWVVGNPPFAAPDEPSQLLRGLSLAGGNLGATPSYSQPPSTFEEAWYRLLSRSVDVPAALVPGGQLPCFAFQPSTTAECGVEDTPFALTAEERLDLDASLGFPEMIARLDAVDVDGNAVLQPTSYQGAYPPVPLIVPGAAGRLGWSPTSADLMGRAGAAASCLALIALGWALLLERCRPVGLRLVGGLVGLTPMVIFLAGTVSASGVEIAAAFAWTCGLVALARTEQLPSGRVLLAVGVAGAVLTSSRQLGVVWLVVAAAIVVFAGGFSRARQLLRERRGATIAATFLVFAGAAFSALWNLVVVPSPPERTLPSSTVDRLGQGVHDLGRLARESVGVFGWLDTTPPLLVHLGWGATLCSLVAVACLVGTRGDRWRLGLLGASVLVIAMMASWVAYSIQAEAQGRWILPVAVSVPVVAGEIAALRWPTVWLSPPSGSVVAATVLLALGHLASLWANSRRYAVGTGGPLMFLGRSQWQPTGGWLLVGSLALGGASLLVLAGVQASAASRVSETTS